MKAITSVLDDNGDDVFSRVTITPISVVKEKVDETFTLLIRGGKVVFPDGTSAQILTTETDSIKVNNRYLFFLTPIDLDAHEFRLTNGAEALFTFSNSNSLQPVAATLKDDGGHPIVGEAKNMTAPALLARLPTLVADLAAGH